MKILVFSPQATLSSTLIGRTLKLMEAVKKEDVRIYALTGDSESSKNEIFNGFKINYYGEMLLKKSKSGKEYYNLFKVVRLFFLAAFKEAKVFLKNLDCERVYLVKNQPMHLLTAIISRIFGKEIILDIDDLEYKSNKKFKWVLRMLDSLLPLLASKIFVCSPFLFEKYRKYKNVIYLPTPLEKIEVNHVDKKSKQCLLYFGSISKHTGHRVDLLLESINELFKRKVQVKAYILGDGTDLNKFKEQYSDLIKAKIIEFVGRYDPKILSHYLKMNCIIVDPIDSTPQNKAKSSSRLLIAAYAKKPYITFRVKDSMQDYYLPKDFIGFVENESAIELSKTIESLLQRHLNGQFSKEYDFIKEFDPKRIKNKFKEEIYGV